MKSKNPVIKQLLEKYQTISMLEKVSAVLNWDLNVNLPPNAAEGRSGQLVYLSNLLTKIYNQKEFRNLLNKANEQTDLDLEELAVVRNLNKSSKFYLKVPSEVIRAKTRATSAGYMIWQEAKKQDKFEDFLPILKKIVELDQVIASHLGYQKNPLDALLDLHEPGLSSEFCQNNIVTLQPGLIKLIKRVQKSKDYVESSPFISGQNNYPIESQKQLAEFISRKMGYDFSSGRMDISAHPFTIGLGRQDIRITNMYKLNDFRDSFTSTMHETGHALYEQNINPGFDNSPLEFGVSFGIHEAMSRFWENQIGKNPDFLTFCTPLFQAFYPSQLHQTNENTFIKLFNLVKPSFIRIEADELTYSLHIILRFELENDLINNKLKVKDLPEAWREKMKKYLGVLPPTDREGVLQDMHWSSGAFGYFPAYVLGNLYASQLLFFLCKDVDLNQVLAKGELGTVLYWLNTNVHKYGSLYYPEQLIQVATGETLDKKYFLNYLEQKYSKIYSL